MGTDILLTVFTPTYNRASLLPELFASLQAQGDRRFRWLVVDDGSTDGTKALVESFQAAARFQIDYIYKENGGKHTALNAMLDVVETELVMIVDSDDYLLSDGVETVLRDYGNIADKSGASAIVYPRAYPGGKIIGDAFPDYMGGGGHDSLEFSQFRTS
jgi:glycosyltransferase involved in cell wall biosynthesis